MRNLLVWLFSITVTVNTVFAETVIISASTITNYSVDIPNGKMLAIHALTGDYGEIGVSFEKQGVYLLYSSREMQVGVRTRYFVGPGKFTVGDTNYSKEYTPNSLARGLLLSYDLMPAQGIETIVVTNNPSPLVSNLANIYVSAGKRLRILDGSFKTVGPPGNGLFPLFRITLTNGHTKTFFLSDGTANGTSPEIFEISGPCTLSITAGAEGEFGSTDIRHYLTYYFVSDISQAPSQSVLSPAGSLVVVEKSPDLTNWYPAFITTDQNDPQSFYRLKISR